MISAKELEKLIFYLGFVKIRQKGSHVFYRHADGRTTTIPHHKGVDLSRPLVRSILREININIDDFNNILEKM